jgi:hypothetical protein
LQLPGGLLDAERVVRPPPASPALLFSYFQSVFATSFSDSMVASRSSSSSLVSSRSAS